MSIVSAAALKLLPEDDMINKIVLYLINRSAMLDNHQGLLNGIMLPLLRVCPPCVKGNVINLRIPFQSVKIIA